MSSGVTDGATGTSDDEVRCSLPDAVVGIGKAGKLTVYQMFEQDWILKEAMEEREDAAPPGLQGFVIDTATEAKRKRDIPKVNSINASIINYAESEFGIDEHLVETELTYINPLDSTPERYKSSAGLTRPAEVETIAEEATLNAWWLEQSQYMLDENEDFSGGVDRRRAVSKALFHASKVNSSPFSEINSPQVYDNITLVVGLGGGTGSGMFIDLAKELDDQITVNLVGIVPHHKEEKKYSANAHAALSELEYLSTSNQENPFNSIVLLPFAPTRQLDDNEKFNEAVVQTIVGYENLDRDEQQGKIELGGNRMSYAPFTIAAPQTLRFDVAQARDAKKAIDDWVEERSTFLETEHKLYDALEDYVRDAFEDEPPASAMEAALDLNSVGPDDFTIPWEEASNLRTRLDIFLNVLEMNEMKRVGYTNSQEWAEDIRSTIVNEEDELPEDVDDRKRNQTVVFQASSLVYTPDEDPAESVRESDIEKIDRFEKYVRSELRAIHRRATLYATSSVITDGILRSALRDALDKGTRKLAASDDLNENLNEITSDVDDLKNNVGCLIAALGNGHEVDLDNSELEESVSVPEVTDDTLEEQVKNEKESWKFASRSDLETLRALDGSVAQVENLLTELNTEIKRAEDRINSWDSSAECVEQPLQFDRFEELREQCQKVGIDSPPNKQEIQDPIRHAASAHEKWLREQEDEQGFFDLVKAVIGLGGSDGSDGLSNEEQYRNLKRELKGTFVELQEFQAPFEANATPERHTQFTTTIEERRDELVSSLADEFENRLQVTGTFPSTVNDTWRGDSVGVAFPGDVGGYRNRFVQSLPEDFSKFEIDRLQRHLLGEVEIPSLPDSGVVDEAFSEALLGPVKDLKSEKETELNRLYDQKQQLERIKQIINELGKEYAANVGESPRQPTIDQDQSATNDYAYFRVVPPSERRLMRRDEDIVDADLWDSQQTVIQRTFGRAGQFIQNSTSKPLMPVDELRLASDTDSGGHGGYEGHRVATVFMSRAFETKLGGNGIFDETEDGFRRAIRLPNGNNGYRARRVGYGAPWDVTMVTFVSGVFLDNISEVTGMNGYRDSYVDQTKELMEDIRVRHTHGLGGLDEDLTPHAGEGGFVTRTELFKLSEPEDVNLICDADEEELVNKFRGLVEETQFQSTVDIDRDTRPERPTKQRPDGVQE